MHSNYMLVFCCCQLWRVNVRERQSCDYVQQAGPRESVVSDFQPCSWYMVGPTFGGTQVRPVLLKSRKCPLRLEMI